MRGKFSDFCLSSKKKRVFFSIFQAWDEEEWCSGNFQKNGILQQLKRQRPKEFTNCKLSKPPQNTIIFHLIPRKESLFLFLYYKTFGLHHAFGSQLEQIGSGRQLTHIQTEHSSANFMTAQ